MKSLAQYQREMLHAIVTGDRATGAQTEAHLTPGTAARFHVYVDGYKARYEESLLDAFPATARFLGHAVFHRLSERYAATHRSNHWDLSQVGWNWSEFLAAQPDLEPYPFLRDLARYEWLLHMIFLVMDTGSPAEFPVEPDALATWRPKFAPTVNIFRSEWPVQSLRDAEEPPLIDGRLQVAQAPSVVLVYRTAAGDVHTLSLTGEQAAFQERLFAGATLGDALEAVPGLTEKQISALTQCWVQSGLLR